MEKSVISSEQMDNLCFASYQLLQAMSNVYGSDPAYEMFLKLEEVLGPEVKGNLFLKMLDSQYTGAGPMHFKFPNGQCGNAILMIRGVREFSVDKYGNKWSLKDAKDVIDTSRFGGIGTIHFITVGERNEFIKLLKSNNGVTI